MPLVSKTELINYRQRFEAELHSILKYWMVYSQIPDGVGFYGAVDLNNQPVMEAPKSCVLTARILWTFAAAARHYQDPEYAAVAEKAFQVLHSDFADSMHKGYLMELDSNNRPLNSVKHSYAQAFVLYSFAKYYEYLPDEKLGCEIADFFVFLDGQIKDPNHPGYLEAFTQEWELIEENRMTDGNEPKSMNTHLHLLEAYAAVYKVWPNGLVKLRLTELVQLFLDHIIRDDGHLGIFFDNNFNETENSKAICSFGHDIEASWLIWEAVQILNNKEIIEAALPVMIRMARAVFREGMDQDGGLFLESYRHGSHVRTNKHWWLQAELLVGEMNAFELTGDEKYWGYLKNTWEFINKFVIDHKRGEWYTKVNRLGKPFLVEPSDDPSPYYRNDWKIDPWKCPYHNGRAMLELMHRIDTLLI